jgi:hypothetical protein
MGGVPLSLPHENFFNFHGDARSAGAPFGSQRQRTGAPADRNLPTGKLLPVPEGPSGTGKFPPIAENFPLSLCPKFPLCLKISPVFPIDA